MTVSLENIGENDLIAVREAAAWRLPLGGFPDAVRRAEAFAGGRAALVQLTGILEQSWRRWGDQGELPTLKVLMANRSTLPSIFVHDLCVLLCEGRGLRVSIERDDAAQDDIRPGEGRGMLASALAGVQAGVKLAQAVQGAGEHLDAAEASNIQMLAADQMTIVRKLSHQAMVATTAPLARRRGSVMTAAT